LDAGDQHAALLLATAIAPAAALLFLRRCRPMKTRVLFALVVLFAMSGQTYYTSGTATALTQTLVPMVGGILVVLFLAPRIIAAVLTVAVVGSGIHLKSEFYELVWGRDWTTPGETMQVRQDRDRVEEEEVIDGVLNAPEPDRPRPAGWLEVTRLINSPRPPERARLTHETVWHTFFTRLDREGRTRQRIWYPGGPPATAATQMEWRDG
jgi:hypothetical protein